MSKKQPSIKSFFRDSSTVGSTKRKSDVSVSSAIKSEPTQAAEKKGRIEEPKQPVAVVKEIKDDIKLLGQKDTLTYESLCDVFEKIEATTKRLIISALLTEFLEQVVDNQSPATLIECIYLCLNRISPEYEGKELGIGETVLVKAIAAATGRKSTAIKSDLAEKGDLGLVAQASKGKQSVFGKPKAHTVSHIFKSLTDISEISGKEAQARKVEIIATLLTSSRSSEPKYLIRSLEGKLRIGLAQQTVLVSLAHAIASREEEYKSLKTSAYKVAYLAEAVVVVKQVYSEIPTYDKIIPVLLKHGFRQLPLYCQLSPGIPLKPMLAHPSKSLTDVLNRFEGMSFTCEYKYDGERAQIHLLEDGRVMVYSRNSENLSPKYPDIIKRMPNCIQEGVTSFVLDCEAVAWDVKQQCILPFQVLSTRKRKDVQSDDIEVQVCIYAFDLLYLNGEALVKKTLKERRDLLHASFQEIKGEFEYARTMDSTSVEDIQTFLDKSIIDNCEGLMVKTLEKDSTYEPSKRSRNWLKVKKDYVNGLGDSLDLVVVGGYFGKGKRTGAYGGYLLACYDDDSEEYQTICKIGTGFSDEDLAKHFEFFKDHVIPAAPQYFKTSEKAVHNPDVWFAPVAVWEIKAADLSISPVYKAAIGMVDNSKGISLRFPRFIRVRDDKTPEMATTSSQVADFYNAQNLNTRDLADDYE